MQPILSGETAPNHRRAPSAVRFVAAGAGGFTVVDGEGLRLPRCSAPAVLHVVEGSGTAVVDEATHRFETADMPAVPRHADVLLSSASGVAPACRFVVDDAPLQRKPGIYEVHSFAVR